jgi:hypothetical protein
MTKETHTEAQPTTPQDDKATAAPSSGNEPYSPDDLVALIRAVKFAHPDMSQRAVHTEITGVVADSDASYAFLKDVKLNDVKKVWKKALKGSESTNGNNEPSKQTQTSNVKTNTEEMPIFPPTQDGILKFYTVGDGSVQTLAENYANHYARIAIESESNTQDNTNYTHFFLDVPADRSGSRPHQALINFNDNKKGKKNKKRKEENEDGRQVFKIQMAAPPPGMEDANLPMLLYNCDRSAKTFLHPPMEGEDEDDGGYFKVKEMIETCGESGALGKSGGHKAYFWGVVREVKEGDGRRIVSINIDELAQPNQVW